MSIQEVINSLSDEMLACAELEQDPLFHKIPRDKIPYYVKESLDKGRQIGAAFAGNSVRALCQREGLKYEITGKSGKFHQVSFRAQIDFAKAPPEITVYSASLSEMQQALEALMGHHESPDMEQLIDIHLAHEFYHYLEYKSGRFTNELLEPIDVLKLGFYTKRSSVVKCSEIAAHAFCKEITGLPYLPNLLDYVYLIENKTMSIEQFKHKMQDWKSWL
ncbi:hypothetical protein J2T12_003229 [Paenibacillus anaericanus]|uniref:hypothetical protein n=1 Tax=Paenibacillus anaericanus TaxID=170367 RepID=UPI00277F8B37|nr:hypothetical protein [Paenibacillus anaericanus]MDQ0089816.1 hypothetical protein [Paenibacillus anaericanus]